ncbi:hypothetical protein STSP2_01397 [Anaerohalosphaera lusitana]|uniref:Uncharacterized protein n=1 Tax=Anaerohalosphaera lusitana TaxID=1936003 RepID=A0A1U9NJZ3_9BACT|nr:hypothetical protein [Anaerohalosphaera lusitana]AQT68241.1 hypothetical protein STSP2_01397 [Anaerohalosphaera lusitana]
MKKVVEGKLYDTEVAEEICYYSYGYSGDFRYCSEVLYKSPNGQFFIEYDGGPYSKYSEAGGPQKVYGSSGIKLVSEDEAQSFVEENGSAEDYIKAFGEPEKG